MGYTSAKKANNMKNGGIVVSYAKGQVSYDNGCVSKDPHTTLLTENHRHDNRFLAMPARLLENMIAYWDFEDITVSSTTYDRIHHYALERDASTSGFFTTTGKFGTGIRTSLYGGNLKITDYQRFSNFSTLVTVNELQQPISFAQEFTIAFWHRPEFRTNHYANLIKRGLGGSDREFSIDIDMPNTASGIVIFKSSRDGATFDVNVSGVVLSQDYHFYTARIDTQKGIAKLRINNNEFKTEFSTGSFFRGSGQFMFASGELVELDGVGFWNKYLNDDEIDFIYNNGTGRDYPFGCNDEVKNTEKNVLEKLAAHRAPRLANTYQLGSPTVSAVVQNAHYYDLFIHSTDSVSLRPDITVANGIISQKNPNAISICYFSTMDVPTGDAGGLTPNRPLNYEYYTGIQPEWYLMNGSGERVRLFVYTTTPESGFYWAFNPSKFEAGRYFSDFVREHITPISGIDGVYFDWMQTKLSPSFNNLSPSWKRGPVDLDQDGIAESSAVLDAMWLSGYKSFLDYNHQYWPENRIHLGNAGWWTGPEYYPYVNGIMIESFRDAANTSYSWHDQMHCYTGYQRFARKPSLGIIQATDTNETGYAFARFTFCSAMLSDGYYINTNSNVDGGYARNRWHDEYAVNRAGQTERSHAAKGYFGNPIGDAYNHDTPSETLYWALNNSTDAHTKKWVREYEKVLVLCNPTTSSGTFNLNRTYRKITGTNDTTFNNGATVTTSISLPPSGGCVLLKPEYFVG